MLLQERGISILEAALCSVLIASLLMLSAGIWKYVDASYGLSAVVEAYAARSFSGAYQYNKSSHNFKIDFSNIKKSFSSEFAESALMELKHQVSENNNQTVRIEFAFTSVNVDPRSGRFLSAALISESDIVSAGSAAIPDFLEDGKTANGEAEFQLALNQYIQKSAENLAIPSISFGLKNASDRFLPEVPLIIVRAVHNLGKSFPLYSLGLIDQPYVWDIKIAALRGDV